MKRLAFLANLFLSTNVLAEERSDVVAKCISAFASGDQGTYDALASEVRSWGTISDAKLSKAASACLALSPTTKQQTADGEEGGSIPPAKAKVDALDTYLKRLDEDPDAIEAVTKELAENANFVPIADQRSKNLEQAILSYVRPLPASKAEENLIAYEALARLVPDNLTYSEKVAAYTNSIEARARADKERQVGIVKKLIKKTEEFDGSSWYRHPSSPRYQDTQSYVTLYVLESGSGKRSI